MAADATPLLVRAFNFEVVLQRSTSSGGSSPILADGAFQECSGLSVDVDVQEYLEGGNNNAVIRRIGRAKLSPIVLKRGMFYSSSASSPVGNADFWTWVQEIIDCQAYPVRRLDGTIRVKTPDASDISATWAFKRGLPAKVVGPTLNAQTGEVAIEELHIVHEELRLVSGS